MKTCGDRVPEALARAMIARGYERLTPVQTAVLADEAQGADLLVSAGTGTGKTLAFGLALAPLLLGQDSPAAASADPRALVITPTRELSLQVQGELAWLYAEAGIRVGCCTGGRNLRAERAALTRGLDIVVGSPGRLRDHIARGSLALKQIGCVVLDEADDMLDLGFRDDLAFILAAAPASRRTLMFSATVTRQIERLASRFQHKAVRIDMRGAKGGPSDIRFEAVTVAPPDRENAVADLLRFHEAPGAIVFCATRLSVAHLAGRLSDRGFKVVALSGALAQRERNAAMAAMRDGRARICVATDVVARGIDLPHLDLVIHADLPTSRESLLHRSGRTGRAGRRGLAVMIVPHSRRRQAETLGARAGIALDWVDPPSPDAILARAAARLIEEQALSAPASEAERALAGRLLAAHRPESIAVALLRLATTALSPVRRAGSGAA